MISPVTIIRSVKERKERCTIWPLRQHPLVHVAGYPFKNKPEVGQATLLWTEGPPLSAADSGRPLLLVDASWRRALAMRVHFPGLECRSLQGIKTAYPRTSRYGTDPEDGLATVEALYAACRILGLPTEGLLDHYLWAGDFLAANGWNQSGVQKTPVDVE